MPLLQARRSSVPWLVGLACLVALTTRPAAASTTVQPGNTGNQTWTPAGSPYVVTGDITVQTGATLTIQAGTLVEFALGDANAGGISVNQSELTVAGSLVVSGTWASPVTFKAETGTAVGTWYGIVVDTIAANATITGAVIRDFQTGLTSGGTTTGVPVVSQTILQNGSIGMTAVNAKLSDVRITGIVTNGIVFYGSGTITNTILDHSGSFAINASNATAGAALVIENCTIDRNGGGVASSDVSQSSVSIVNSLVTNNTAYGLLGTSLGGISTTYSDVWNNASNYDGASAGTGTISANPLYVSTTDYHLQAGSFAIDTGTPSGAPDHDFDLNPRPQDGDGINGAQFDMGAYEYPGVAATDGGTSTGGAAGTGAAGHSGTGGAAGGGGAGTGGAAGSGGSGAAGIGGGVAGTGGGAAGTSGGSGAAGLGGSTAGAGGAAGTPGSGGAAGGGGMIVGSAGSSGSGTAGAGGVAAGRGGAGAQGASGGSGGGNAGAGGGQSGSGSSGCGCETGGGRPEQLPFALGLLGAVLFARRRRRS